MNAIEAFNQSLFLRLNAGAGTSAWVIKATRLLADDLIFLIPALLLALWFWSGGARRNLAIKAGIVAMLGVGANQVIGLVWQHPRPFMIGLGHAWLPHAADSSFPSDHATVFACVGLTLLFHGEAGLAATTLIAGLVVAWARVFLGVHFPLDMAGGAGIAVVAYGIVSPLWSKAGGPVTDLAERLYRKVLGRPIAFGWIRP